jgi:cell division protein FtsL
MRKHWVASTLIALLVIAAQVVIVWGPLYLRHLASVTFDDHEQLVRQRDDVAAQNRDLIVQESKLVDPKSLNREITDLKSQIEEGSRSHAKLPTNPVPQPFALTDIQETILRRDLAEESRLRKFRQGFKWRVCSPAA